MPITSNASRNINQFKSRWFEKKTFKQLTFRKISKAGRNKYGRIIIWTKSSIKQRLLFPKINYSFRYRWIGVVGTFRLIPFQNKLTALVFFSSGGISYLQTSDKFKRKTGYKASSWEDMVSSMRQHKILNRYWGLNV